MTDKTTTPRGPISLGLDQRITFLLADDDFSGTDGDSVSCLAGLEALSIESREDLTRSIHSRALVLRKNARKDGAKLLESQVVDTKAEYYTDGSQAIAEATGVDVDKVVLALKAQGIVMPEPSPPRGPKPYEVTITFSGERNDPGDEYMAYCNVLAAGRHVGDGHNFHDCAEDANLGRDLGFVYDLPSILKEAWVAGKDGREYVLVEVENDGDG